MCRGRLGYHSRVGSRSQEWSGKSNSVFTQLACQWKESTFNWINCSDVAIVRGWINHLEESTRLYILGRRMLLCSPSAVCYAGENHPDRSKHVAEERDKRAESKQASKLALHYSNNR